MGWWRMLVWRWRDEFSLMVKNKDKCKGCCKFITDNRIFYCNTIFCLRYDYKWEKNEDSFVTAFNDSISKKKKYLYFLASWFFSFIHSHYISRCLSNKFANKLTLRSVNNGSLATLITLQKIKKNKKWQTEWTFHYKNDATCNDLLLGCFVITRRSLEW